MKFNAVIELLFMNFNRWLEQRKRRKVFKSLRGHMKFFGFDMSEITDEEIEEGAIRTAKMMRLVGVTVQEASDALKRLAVLKVKPEKSRPAGVKHWCDHCNKAFDLTELEKFFARWPDHDENPSHRFSRWVLLCEPCSKTARIIDRRR